MNGPAGLWLRARLFALARIPLFGGMVRGVFASMPFLLPVHRLRETPTWLAFHHPHPSYPLHILLVPKRAYRSLLDVPIDDAAFQRDFLEMVQSLVCEYGLVARGYRLIANGGPNQDIPLLHFHLISDYAQQISGTFNQRTT